MTPVEELERRPQEVVHAHEALSETVEILSRRFDLDAYDRRLEQAMNGEYKSAAPISLAEFERPLHFPGFPEGFKPHMFRKYVGDTQASLRPTRTEFLAEFEGVTVLDKREDTHENVRAFKARGALCAVLQAVSDNPDIRVFKAMSSGNHARGLVSAVNLLNRALIESGAVRVNKHGEVLAEDAHKLFQAHIYAAKNIDPGKRQALVEGGAKIFDRFDTLEGAEQAAHREAKFGKKAALIHPFSNPNVVAGQATLGLELLLDLAQRGVNLRKEPVTLRVAVGGGGLYKAQAAVFERAKAKGLLHPDSCVVAVEANDNDSANREARGLEPLTSETLNPLAGGIATLKSDSRNVEVIKALSPGGVSVVDEDHMALAADMLAQAHEGVPPEMAGTLSLASFLQDGAGRNRIEVTVTCGGNGSPEQLYEFADKKRHHEDERIAAAAERLGYAVFALMSRDALETPTPPVSVAQEPHQESARVVLKAISQSFAKV